MMKSVRAIPWLVPLTVKLTVLAFVAVSVSSIGWNCPRDVCLLSVGSGKEEVGGIPIIGEVIHGAPP